MPKRHRPRPTKELSQVSDCRVDTNSELKRGNYGRISSNGVCFWDAWSGCTRSFGKTNKDPKRKRNFRRELQGRVIHCLYLNSDGGVVSKND